MPSASFLQPIAPTAVNTCIYDPANPQSFNRFAYVLNAPLSFIDSLGLCDFSSDGSSVVGLGTDNPGNVFNYDPKP
jgi:hypothetical protein